MVQTYLIRGMTIVRKSVIQGSLNKSFESDDIGTFSLIYEDYFETLNVFYSNQNNQSIEVNHLRFELDSNSLIIHENNTWSDYSVGLNLTSVGVIQSELNIMLRWFADDCDNVSSDGIFEICGVDLLSNDFGIEVSSDVNFDSFYPNESRNVTVNITSLFLRRPILICSPLVIILKHHGKKDVRMIGQYCFPMHLLTTNLHRWNYHSIIQLSRGLICRLFHRKNQNMKN